MTIKLIATDMDGTFLDDDGHYNHLRFQQLMTQMTQRGIHFVVASGNHYPHLPPYFQDIKGDITYVAENGAYIVDEKIVLSEDVIASDLVKKVLSWRENDAMFKPAWLILSGRQGAYTEMPASSQRFARSQYFYNNLTSVLDLNDVKDDIFKLDFTWSNADVSAQEQRFNTTFAGQLRATSSGLGGLDVILPHVNKAYGLKKLQRKWGISAAETMAFGDNANDIEMLHLAKFGYAMANATQRTQTATANVTKLDNNHGGVLDVIADHLNREAN